MRAADSGRVSGRWPDSGDGVHRTRGLPRDGADHVIVAPSQQPMPVIRSRDRCFTVMLRCRALDQVDDAPNSRSVAISPRDGQVHKSPGDQEDAKPERKREVETRVESRSGGAAVSEMVFSFFSVRIGWLRPVWIRRKTALVLRLDLK